MATYRQNSEYVRRENGVVVKTCWIAHVLFDNGLTKRQAINRVDSNMRIHPCPESKRGLIENALRHFGMIQRDVSNGTKE
jgi:hypothetical protein